MIFKISVLLPFLLLATQSQAAVNIIKTQQPIKSEIKLIQCNLLASLTNIKIPTARSGCCSWHQGVCGCSGGKAVCCDGTYSSGCGC